MAGAWLVPGGEEHKRYPAKMTFVVFCIILLGMQQVCSCVDFRAFWPLPENTAQ